MTTDKEWRAIYIMEIHMCERSERYNVIDTTTKKKKGGRRRANGMLRGLSARTFLIAIQRGPY